MFLIYDYEISPGGGGGGGVGGECELCWVGGGGGGNVSFAHFLLDFKNDKFYPKYLDTLSS